MSLLESPSTRQIKDHIYPATSITITHGNCNFSKGNNKQILNVKGAFATNATSNSINDSPTGVNNKINFESPNFRKQKRQSFGGRTTKSHLNSTVIGLYSPSASKQEKTTQSLQNQKFAIPATNYTTHRKSKITSSNSKNNFNLTYATIAQNLSEKANNANFGANKNYRRHSSHRFSQSESLKNLSISEDLVSLSSGVDVNNNTQVYANEARAVCRKYTLKRESYESTTGPPPLKEKALLNSSLSDTDSEESKKRSRITHSRSSSTFNNSCVYHSNPNYSAYYNNFNASASLNCTPVRRRKDSHRRLNSKSLACSIDSNLSSTDLGSSGHSSHRETVAKRQYTLGNALLGKNLEIDKKGKKGRKSVGNIDILGLREKVGRGVKLREVVAYLFSQFAIKLQTV